jgi:leader peptidase (prepilin peptidase)/N-methyltransferase
MNYELSLLPAPLWPFLAGIFGAMLGSFAGVVVYRLPIMLLQENPGMNLSWPGSHCGHCHQALKWWHNLPLLSYLILRGRCGFCQTPYSPTSFVLELSMAGLWSGMVAYLGPSPAALAWAGFFSVLLILSFIDWQTMLLPDALTLPLMWAGLLLASLGLTTLSLQLSVWGAAGGYCLLWFVAGVFKRVQGVEGMGQGDLKLMAALGAWLGPWALLPLLFVSSALHMVMALSCARTKNPFPFGPALALAAALVWLGDGQDWFGQLLN